MALLEGLEISVLKLSEVNIRNDRFRFDSEFFKKEYLKIEKSLYGLPHKCLSNIDYLLIHPNEMKREYVGNNGKWFFRAQNVRPLKIDLSNQVFISNEDAKRLSKNSIKKYDVVITRTGANFGQTALYNIDNFAIGSSHTFILRNDFFNQSYLAVFLNTRYGRRMIDKGAYGGLQPEIAPYYLSNIPIPVFSSDFQICIEKLLLNSESLTNKSQTKYAQAEDFLLNALGLKGFRPSQESINIKNFSESYGSSGRLDAEYYQIKYEEVVSKIRATNHERLANLVNIGKSIEPGSAHYSDEGLPFVRVSDYDKFGLSTPDKYLTDEFCKENTELVKGLKPKKETILLSKDGSVGTAYMLREDAVFITSGAILHLTVKDKNKVVPEYLVLVLNSNLVQMQAERDAGGSIILHWRISEIENMVLPVIDFDKQQKIADLINESFMLRKQSGYLLETAKTAVEMAIDQNEETAIAHIRTLCETKDFHEPGLGEMLSCDQKAY